MEKILNNPWVIEIGVAIAGGLVLYHLFGIGKVKKEKTSSIVSPIFWTSWNKKIRIDAVHEYEKSNDISGYKHLSQNSRPDQINSLVKIVPRWLGLKSEVIPLDNLKILRVIVSRDGKEIANSIHFNN